MKKNTKTVHVSLKDYEAIRRLAFRLHKPMGAIISELLRLHATRAKRPGE